MEIIFERHFTFRNVFNVLNVVVAADDVTAVVVVGVVAVKSDGCGGHHHDDDDDGNRKTPTRLPVEGWGRSGAVTSDKNKYWHCAEWRRHKSYKNRLLYFYLLLSCSLSHFGRRTESSKGTFWSVHEKVREREREREREGERVRASTCFRVKRRLAFAACVGHNLFFRLCLEPSCHQK